MKRDPQTSFTFRSHGGSREHAGRKRKTNELPHTAREKVTSAVPVHVNFKLMPEAPSLRTPEFMRALPKILANASACGLRTTQFVIEDGHVHAIVEADDNEALARGMSSLKNSIIWALRKIYGYFDKVFLDRYYAHFLRTPTEVKNAIRYVLFNHAKHTKTAFFADVYSSIFAFEEREIFAKLNFYREPPWFAAIRAELSEARSWLQRTGWKRSRA